MSLVVRATAESNIKPIEPGTYPAVCYGLVDLGEQYSKTYDKWIQKILIMWEIPGETIDLGGEQPVSRSISKMYTSSLGTKAALRRDLESWRGRAFTDAELSAFDMRTILGASCLLSIVHRETSQGQPFADVNSVMKIPRGMFCDLPTLDKITFDLDVDEFSKLDLLPEWVSNKIKESRTYELRVNPPKDILESDILADAERAEREGVDDEDIPF